MAVAVNKFAVKCRNVGIEWDECRRRDVCHLIRRTCGCLVTVAVARGPPSWGNLELTGIDPHIIIVR